MALDQWNERMRPWLANKICLFAPFPRAMLLLITSILHIRGDQACKLNAAKNLNMQYFMLVIFQNMLWNMR